MTEAAESSVEGRLRALEAQQKTDHGYFGDLRQAFTLLGNYLDDEKAKREREKMEQGNIQVETRGLIAQTREQLWQDVENAVPISVQAAVQALRQEVENAVPISVQAAVQALKLQQKFEDVEQAMAKMRAVVTELNNKGGAVAETVAKLRDDQPSDGQVIATTFVEVGVELLSVKEKIQRLETSSAATAAAAMTAAAAAQAATPMDDSTMPFTKAMFSELDSMRQQVQNLLNGAPAVGWRLDALEAASSRDQQDGDLLVQACGGLQGLTAGGGCCGGGRCGPSASASGPGFTVPSGSPANPPGIPSSAGGEGLPPNLPQTIAALTSGIGGCHCFHLDQLWVHAQDMEQRVIQLERRPAPVRLPPARGNGGGGGDGGSGWPGAGAPTEERERDPTAPLELPLDLYGLPFGSLDYKDKEVFDDKLAMQSDFKFDGVKGGLQWKGKLERHFIARAPIMQRILKWAEREDTAEITVAKFEEAVAGNPEFTPMHVGKANAAIWGFLSNTS